MKNAQTSIAIVGGGIGGLTAAIAILRAGLDVHVYEQKHDLREAGAGIQISPNASRVLHRLGLAEKLAKTAVRPQAWHQRRWDDGRTLLRTPLGDTVEAVFGFPHVQMHRADLLDVLRDAFPAERLHPGHRFTDCTDHGDHVKVSFDNGTRIECDVFVGADGIHSAARRVLFGDDAPRFTGCVAYRGLVPASRLTPLGLPLESQVWMGPGKHFVHYFVQRGAMVNFVAVVDQDAWARESWIEPADIAQSLAAFEGWHPQVRTILAAVDETFVWGLFDRSPMAQWSIGRCTLLGDACHAMLPFMAQGAAQAIEDGATLAACLAKIGPQDFPGALMLYQSVRLPRASRVQAASKENKTRFHLADGPLQHARDAQMANGATDWSFKAVEWLYGYDAAVVDV
ncbi:FAD-dependent monooxygenase [Variovorax sp. J22R133]|uniref:FAD-dependent monooxygenase n=1 Tax=Variovorax brevis TaxID=3053503 RepID=UPI002577658D|nr:FAD-dependent monooxygenase [Variovorax sp. J22R133]MDM0117263.1 FAD-dependent monooxygenase [Variovorax sp. J22R133]